MTGQLGQLLLAVDNQPFDNPSVTNNNDYNPSANNDNDDEDDNTYKRYYRNEYETVTSLPPNNLGLTIQN